MVRALDEEKKQLLRMIVERLAWRQIASINMLGHCLKYIPELDTKLTVAAELDLALGLFRQVLKNALAGHATVGPRDNGTKPPPQTTACLWPSRPPSLHGPESNA